MTDEIPDIVAGLGARDCAGLGEVLALLDAGLAAQGLTRANVAACATAGRKAQHPALSALAVTLGVPLWIVADADLRADVPNPSKRVARHVGLPSVAEASAMAFGPLLAPKSRSANATCALARLDFFYVSLVTPSAESAASMLSTSLAGP